MRSAVMVLSGRGQRAQLPRLLVVLTVATCALLGWASAAQATTFNPELIITDANMRDYTSLSAAQIQGFLDGQKGPLKTLVTPDHNGKNKTAAQIISDACTAWKINPRVMLTMLQKEQSLLTRTTLMPHTLERAVGAGCPNGHTNYYPGFGNQIWNGARLLDGYGEGKHGSTIPLWKSPYTTVTDIYQSPHVSVKTRSLATYKLYIYNPSIGAKTPYGDLRSQVSNLSGNANFWWIYSVNFGSPLAAPVGYHTRAIMRKTTQLWNSTIGTRRHVKPRRGGAVHVVGNLRVVHGRKSINGRKYIDIAWGGNSGSVLYSSIRFSP